MSQPRASFAQLRTPVLVALYVYCAVVSPLHFRKLRQFVTRLQRNTIVSRENREVPCGYVVTLFLPFEVSS